MDGERRITRPMYCVTTAFQENGNEKMTVSSLSKSNPSPINFPLASSIKGSLAGSLEIFERISEDVTNFVSCLI